ncbi:SDR family oxidoreductase [Chryseobacterium sp. MFBS3-17]|uniref:SDR family oxidoreductase n=1 Tax=Chryseobacterium sp. MFBS3-17 TaxID=2886689 RepID=UPI001D0E7E97|nr:SDR family oxidoreductase [Chryseobacterium sp. MFBS3-17]MCC2590215.1 SDR family oxidoreductase [Chryseobacterium sp. MFBS3-17]
MKIFVTGATGYIGSYVTELLLAEGHTVHALCREPTRVSITHPNLKLFRGDITHQAALQEAMEGCSQVYHLAAYAKSWAKDPAIYYRVNVDAVEQILNIAQEQQVEKIVFTSTAAVLGPSYGTPLTEKDSRKGEAQNEYEDSKAQAEALCRRYVQEKNMNIVMVNPPRIYGPGVEQESNSITKLLKQYDEGKWKIIPGNGEGIGSYVHVEDVARGHLLAMKHGKPGERYILSGENLSYNEFFRIIRKTTGKNYRLYKIPLPFMLLAGHMMVLREKLTGIPPLLTPKWIRKYNEHYALSSAKAEEELGYKFRKFEEGLKETYDIIKKN